MSGSELPRTSTITGLLQNYFTKAAHIILHSRVSLPPAYHKGTDTKRVNKWVSYSYGMQSSFGPRATVKVMAKSSRSLIRS